MEPVKPQSQWAQTVARNPGHSQFYIDRFAKMAAAGHDLVGEARLIDAMAPRGARILDAGCGPGRHCGYLHRAGHQVVGIDLDPVLIAEAERAEPGPIYSSADLLDFELPTGSPTEFDLILSAGNVMTFLHPDTRVPILRRLGGLLAAEGRLVVGFGAGRGYEFTDFIVDADSVDLELQQVFNTWDLKPFETDADFMVAVLTKA